jgi:hypothetical protein
MVSPTMDDYQVDSYIINAIKNGNHRYNQISRKVPGSRQRFDKRLTQLVKDKKIAKIETKDGHEYHINNIEDFNMSQDLFSMLTPLDTEDIKRLQNSNDDEVLREFAVRTVDYGVHSSLSRLITLLDVPESVKASHNHFIKKIERYNKSIIEFMEKRDPMLIPLFLRQVEMIAKKQLRFLEEFENLEKM